jgi:hypothetical protein
MRSQTLLALSLCALASIVAAGCAKSAPDANSNAASSSTSTNGAAQPASATGQASANAPVPPAAPGVAANNSTSQGAKQIDACALLTSDDIKAVQGEAVKDTKASAHNDAPLNVSQCFFTTTTFNKSVSLEVTSGASGGRGAREFWDKQFARAREEAGHEGKKSEREKKKAEPRAGGEEDEEGSLPVPVKGVGDEAYWAASNVNGTLYARKGDAFVRVSIGGTDNEATRLSKVKTLAQKALARL